jgi:hypothetical protein
MMSVLRRVWTFVTSINHHVLWLVVVLIAIFLSLLYSWNHPVQVGGPTYVQINPIKEVIHIKKVTVPIDKIVVLEKNELIKKLSGLPQSFIDNPLEQGTTTGVVKRSRTDTNVISIINTGTGESYLYSKSVPQKLLGFSQDKTWGGRFGIDRDGQKAEVFGGMDFYRIGPAYLGGYTEIGTHLDNLDNWEGKIMFQVSFKTW